jgi:deazaflavin-dependent oxidoreductase (nitroreductase family)
MSISQRMGAGIVALFALAFTRAPGLIRMSNPLMRRLLATRLPAGPNALLTVRGRRSGLPRTSPVAFLDLGERSLLQAASGDVEWVANPRAARDAAITRSGRSRRYEATELDARTAGRLLHAQLAAFPRSRLVRRVVGPLDRPPIAVLDYFRVRVDTTLDEYIAAARRQPVFELRRPSSVPVNSPSGIAALGRSVPKS